jgi:murein L,D-transpeptidase YcbB/YkuD
VPALRARLRAEDYDAGTDSGEHYQGALVEAVRAFQRDNRLAADGVVGAATLAVLNVPAATRVGQLRVNLERLRWFAREREAGFVLVDVAGAAIAYFRDGEPVWHTRAQVGRPERATPLLKSEITHFTFNPTWTVPPTILREDKLPLIRRDPSYLERNRMRVIGPDGRVIPPAGVDWSRPGGVMLRQDAGPDNALGQVAIRFPNPFAVYLHDTPSRNLFAREQRTTSSGCVRVENALELVGLLSADGGGPDADTVASILASRRTRHVTLARPMPILIAYWTAAVGSDGRVTFRPDIYGLDPLLLQALAAPRQALSVQLRAPRARGGWGGAGGLAGAGGRPACAGGCARILRPSPRGRRLPAAEAVPCTELKCAFWSVTTTAILLLASPRSPRRWPRSAALPWWRPNATAAARAIRSRSIARCRCGAPRTVSIM